MRHRRLLVSSFVFAVSSLAFPASAADLLFPTPLHLTRQLHDSIGGSTTTVDQYCYGNRVITVAGPLTSIADYSTNELTEINRAEGTYSITRFDDVAKALSYGAPSAADVKAASEWKVKSGGLNQLRTNRASEAVEAELTDANHVKRTTRVAVDRSVRLSKDALDVLIGAAYPNNRKVEDHVVLEAAKPRGGGIAANAAGGAGAYALPVEQHTTITIDGQSAEMRDVVTRVGEELVPADTIAVPPDARLVESRLLQRMQAIEQIENAGRTPLPQKQ